MRDRMERLVLLPFSIGCVSESSVAIGIYQPRRTKTDRNLSATRTKEEEEEEEEEESSSSTKNSLKFLALSKPNVSTGFHRLVKGGLKTFSQLFAYKEEIEELEMEMEIGVPTNVKHVTHIGWDASPDTDPVQSWDNLISTDFVSLQMQLQGSLSLP